MTTIKPFIDKENVAAGGLSLKSRVGSKTHHQGDLGFATPRKALGNVNWVLQSSKQTTSSSKKGVPQNGSLKCISESEWTPRRVLCDVNGGLQSFRQTPGLNKGLNTRLVKNENESSCRKHSSDHKPVRQPLASISQNAKPASVKSKPIVPQLFQRVNSNSSTKKAEVEDEIETMPVYKDEEDDYEDIWPKKERISTYLDKLIKWRPPCFFGSRSSDDDLALENPPQIEVIPPTPYMESNNLLLDELLELEVLEDVELPMFQDTMLPGVD